MGLVHTPRVFASIAKGFYRGRQNQAAAAIGAPGFSIDNPYVSTAHVGLFDVDHYAHMNNASYLNHAEYARWEWSAQNGVLKTCFDRKCMLIGTSNVVRYRREMHPLFRKFTVDTALCGVDDRTYSFYHTFRYPGTGGVNKIRAQVLHTGIIRRGREVINPKQFMIEEVGADPAWIDSLEYDKMPMEDVVQKNSELQDMLKEAAAADDLRVDPPKASS